MSTTDIRDFGTGPIVVSVDGQPTYSTFRQRTATRLRNLRATFARGRTSPLDGLNEATR